MQNFKDTTGDFKELLSMSSPLIGAVDPTLPS